MSTQCDVVMSGQDAARCGGSVGWAAAGTNSWGGGGSCSEGCKADAPGCVTEQGGPKQCSTAPSVVAKTLAESEGVQGEASFQCI